ncbi:MAG TPA: DUF1569 domain-containing protein [Gemmatimonadaceae bacterium]|jgi:hypothetical protein|nr:DUF1569 domain-containing protein [Gemmatimonadaceae bacterium]
MPSLLQPDAREVLRRRAARLTPTTAARWGQFTAPRMLAHVIQSLRMMTGELPVAVEPTPWLVRHAPLRQLLIYVLPFPRGLATSPELLARPSAQPAEISPAAWAEEQREFGRVLDAIGARASADAWPEHPAFGRMSGRDWGVLQYRHLEHHFRQFAI